MAESGEHNPILVVAADLPGHPDARLDERCRVLRPVDGVVMSAAEFRDALPGATAVVSLLTHRVDAAALRSAPFLRIVANVAVGYDNVDVAEATARGVLVTNTPDVLTETTADLAWALILGVARGLIPNDRFLRQGRYEQWLPGLRLSGDVHGRTLGLLGLGRIGRAVARRAVGFGMRILYYQPRRLEASQEATLQAEWVPWEDLLAHSDYLSVHCPLNADTHHLIDGPALSRMKPTAILINTARGPVVDEAALAQALQRGDIAGAGLDVYEREPEVHPGLLPLPNVVLLPHLGSASHPTREAMAALAVQAVEDFLDGRRPHHPVNPEVLEA